MSGDPLNHAFLLTKGPAGGLCRLGQLLRDASATESASLLAYVDNVNVSATRLAIALTFYDFPVGETTIRKHRRGECLCRLTMP